MNIFVFDNIESLNRGLYVTIVFYTFLNHSLISD